MNHFDTDFAEDISHHITHEMKPELGHEELEFFRQVLLVLIKSYWYCFCGWISLCPLFLYRNLA